MSTTNHHIVRFILHARSEPGAPLEIIPYVSNSPLTDLIHTFELRAGMESRPVSYGGLIPSLFNFGPLDQHYLGVGSALANHGKVPLLGCECGEWGCWPLLARVTQTEDAVIWSDFEQPHRKERDYSGFGPFQFHRGQYQEALVELQALVKGRPGAGSTSSESAYDATA